MDDVTLGGPRDIVAYDVPSVTAEETNIRLYLNTDNNQKSNSCQLSTIDKFVQCQ